MDNIIILQEMPEKIQSGRWYTNHMDKVNKIHLTPTEYAKGYNQALSSLKTKVVSREELLSVIRDTGAPRGMPLEMSELLVDAIFTKMKGEK